MASTAWFNVFPAGEHQSGGTVPPGTRTVYTPVGSPAYSAWMGNGSYQGLQVFTGPFSSQAEAQQDLQSKHPGPGAVLPAVTGIALGLGNENPDAALSTGQDAQNAADTSLTGINAIGDFFSKLGKSNTWIRVAKVLVGGVLLIIGIAHITGADNAIASTARKVPVPI